MSENNQNVKQNKIATNKSKSKSKNHNYKKKRNFLAILGAIGVAIIIAAIHGLFIDI